MQYREDPGDDVDENLQPFWSVGFVVSGMFPRTLNGKHGELVEGFVG